MQSMHTPAEGLEIWLNGRPIQVLDPASRGVAMVFQDYALIRT
jgi:ABC-type Fe3+/spermidine/putrescine transport system ATPase subunit